MLNTNTDKNGVLKKEKMNYGWILVAILLFGAVVNFLDRVNLSIANTTIAHQFSFSSPQMGLLLSAFLWPYALSNLPAGWLVDKYGPKKLFTIATLLWSIATVMGGFSQGFASLYASRVLLGIAEAPFYICGAKITQKWFDERERGLATSIFNMGAQISNAIAPPLLTLILLSFGWRVMFIGLGLTGFSVTFLWLKFYKDKDNAKTSDVVASNKTENTKVSWGVLFKHPSTWAMMAGNCGLLFVFWVYLTWLPAYLSTQRGLSLMKTGWYASIPYLVGMVGVPLGGFLSDILIRKAGFKAINARKTIIVTGAFLAAAAVAPVAYVESLNIAMLLLSIGFFSSSLTGGVVWTLAADVAPPELVGSLGSIQNFAGYIGGTLAPILTGVIVAQTGSFNYVFIASSVICIMGALSYGLCLKRKIEITE
jgi:MFS family permease